MDIIVNMTIFCKDQEQAMKVVELLGRTGLGLAMDGLPIHLNINNTENEEIETNIDENRE